MSLKSVVTYLFDSLIPAFEVTASSSQQHVVGMPVQTEDGGADRLLDVLTHPPAGNSTAWLEFRIIKRSLSYKSGEAVQ